MNLRVYKAASEGNFEALCVLVTPATGNMNDTNAFGWTALYLAARYGHTAVVHYLVEIGADVNVRCHIGWTALHAASYDGHADIVRILFHAGAVVDTMDNDGYTPLYEAIRFNLECARLLIDCGARVENVKVDGTYFDQILDTLCTATKCSPV
jgi:ankyrin repeat protein